MLEEVVVGADVCVAEEVVVGRTGASVCVAEEVVVRKTGSSVCVADEVVVTGRGEGVIVLLLEDVAISLLGGSLFFFAEALGFLAARDVERGA